MKPKRIPVAPVAFLISALSIAPGFAQDAGLKVAQPVTEGVAGSVATKIEAPESAPPEVGPANVADREIASSPEASAAVARTGSGTWNGLPNRFRLNAGGFRVDAETNLKLESETNALPISFENRLKLPKIAQTFWVDGAWQIGRRHELSLTYTRVRRKGPDVVLNEAINFGEVFDPGDTVAATVNTSLLSGYYRFAIKKTERFEIGPTVGIGYLRADATLRFASDSEEVGGGSGSKAVPIGAVGGYFRGWLSRRVVVRGDFLYLKATVKSVAVSIVDARAALDIYPSRHLGAGIQYKYDRYSGNRNVSDENSSLNGKLTYQGIQYYVSFLF